MTATGVLAVIPARIGSERLPRKPLVPLAGRPLIEWVWRRARSFDVLDRVVVATDSAEVADVCRGFGAEAVLTAATHPSGTDRVAEVALAEAYRGARVVVNVQGDEPFLEQDAVGAAVRMVDAGFDVGTVAAPVFTLEAWHDPKIVKVVCGSGGRALYFSRAPVPFLRSGEPSTSALAAAPFLRHLGVYAYRPAALARWVAMPEGELERVEKLEQLRPLAAGLTIGVGVVARAEVGIDTPEDARRADARLRGSAG